MTNVLVALPQYGDLALLVMRLSLAAIFLVHGRTKWGMLGAKGKKPMDGVMKILAVAEPLGGAAMLLGFLTQWAGLGFAIIMLGAMSMKSQWKKPFAGEGGWEFDFSLFALSVAMMVLGAGAYSLDRMLLGW